MERVSGKMAEKKYIDSEAAYTFFKDQLEEETGAYSKGRNAGLRVAMSAVMNKDAIAAADVRPVVRGHKVAHNRPIAGYWASGKLDGGWDGMEGRVWVEPIMDNPVDYCSECGKRHDDTFQNFCPNCGADMREES
jgi:hypothetical protein